MIPFLFPPRSRDPSCRSSFTQFIPSRHVKLNQAIGMMNDDAQFICFIHSSGDGAKYIPVGVLAYPAALFANCSSGDGRQRVMV
jgi:hypothetical protein